MMIGPWLCTLILSVAAQPPAAASLPVLHLEEAVRDAIAAQPTLRQARAQVLSAEAKANEARAALLPQLSTSFSYLRTTVNQIPRPGFFNPAGRPPPSWQTHDYYNGSTTLSQTLFDVGSYESWRSAGASAQAQQAAESATELTTVLTVRTAFFNAVGNKALARVAADTVANQQRHLDEVRGYVEVGSRPQIDLVQARSNLATAQVQKIQANNNYFTAKAQLVQALGREGPPNFEVADEQLPPIPGEDEPFSALFQEALSTRPELVQLESQIRAQELQIVSARSGYLPTFGVSTSSSYGGLKLTDLGWNWDAQATLTWQLFQGGLTKATVNDAEATLMALEAQRDGARQSISLEVEQARLGVQAAKTALDAANVALENATVLLRLAEARYQAGVGNIIELGDAQLAKTNAAAQKVQSEFSLATARAQLLKALGRP
jgi:outer membrane protein